MKKTILIIEDYPNVVEVLRMRLENAGYHVLVAFDGQEGLKLAREKHPDLIILDIMLPKMNGYKLCRILKFDVKYKDIPVFMLTSRAKKSDQEMGKATGADEYIMKPYDPRELMQMIHRYLHADVPKPLSEAAQK
ncbi:MAG: response regulator [Calditrichaeota bacterium]|nr:MAG: response regulator [Calditrichota bacterium]